MGQATRSTSRGVGEAFTNLTLTIYLLCQHTHTHKQKVRRRQLIPMAEKVEGRLFLISDSKVMGPFNASLSLTVPVR